MNKTPQTLTALVIEDDAILRRSIKRALQAVAQNILEADSYASALEVLKTDVANIIILDIHLPDGSGVDLAEAISHLKPMPKVLAISGEASAEQAFRLNTHGVQAYLSKPFSLTEFEQKLSELLVSTPDIEPHVSALVGQRSIRDVSSTVRKTMLEQALAMSNGNKTKAGKILNLTRQAVQQMIVDLEVDTEPFK